MAKFFTWPAAQLFSFLNLNLFIIDMVYPVWVSLFYSFFSPRFFPKVRNRSVWNLATMRELVSNETIKIFIAIAFIVFKLKIKNAVMGISLLGRAAATRWTYVGLVLLAIYAGIQIRFIETSGTFAVFDFDQFFYLLRMNLVTFIYFTSSR